MGKYKKALKEIADIIWEGDPNEMELESIARVIDRTDRTLWDKP